jgi:hypothetical protein
MGEALMAIIVGALLSFVGIVALVATKKDERSARSNENTQ